MLPRIATPSAYPNSPLVCPSAAAEPARSGGAAPMIRLVPSVTSGPVPRQLNTKPMISTKSRQQYDGRIHSPVVTSRARARPPRFVNCIPLLGGTHDENRLTMSPVGPADCAQQDWTSRS